jgi:hypothetical protein
MHCISARRTHTRDQRQRGAIRRANWFVARPIFGKYSVFRTKWIAPCPRAHTHAPTAAKSMANHIVWWRAHSTHFFSRRFAFSRTGPAGLASSTPERCGCTSIGIENVAALPPVLRRAGLRCGTSAPAGSRLQARFREPSLGVGRGLFILTEWAKRLDVSRYRPGLTLPCLPPGSLAHLLQYEHHVLLFLTFLEP